MSVFSHINTFYPKFYFCLLWIQLLAFFGLLLEISFPSPLFSTFLCHSEVICKYPLIYFVFQKTQRVSRSFNNKSCLRLGDEKNCPHNKVLQILQTTWKSIEITGTKLVPFYICPSGLGSFESWSCWFVFPFFQGNLGQQLWDAQSWRSLPQHRRQ